MFNANILPSPVFIYIFDIIAKLGGERILVLMLIIVIDVDINSKVVFNYYNWIVENKQVSCLSHRIYARFYAKKIIL